MFSATLLTIGFIDMIFAGYLVGESQPFNATVVAVCGIYLMVRACQIEAKNRVMK